MENEYENEYDPIAEHLAEFLDGLPKSASQITAEDAQWLCDGLMSNEWQNTVSLFQLSRWAERLGSVDIPTVETFTKRLCDALAITFNFAEAGRLDLTDPQLAKWVKALGSSRVTDTPSGDIEHFRCP